MMIRRLLLSLALALIIFFVINISPVLAENQYTQTNQMPPQTDQTFKQEPYTQTKQTFKQEPYIQTEQHPKQEPYMQSKQTFQQEPYIQADQKPKQTDQTHQTSQ